MTHTHKTHARTQNNNRMTSLEGSLCRLAMYHTEGGIGSLLMALGIREILPGQMMSVFEEACEASEHILAAAMSLIIANGPRASRADNEDWLLDRLEARGFAVSVHAMTETLSVRALSSRPGMHVVLSLFEEQLQEQEQEQEQEQGKRQRRFHAVLPNDEPAFYAPEDGSGRARLARLLAMRTSLDLQARVGSIIALSHLKTL